MSAKRRSASPPAGVDHLKPFDLGTAPIAVQKDSSQQYASFEGGPHRADQGLAANEHLGHAGKVNAEAGSCAPNVGSLVPRAIRNDQSPPANIEAILADTDRQTIFNETDLNYGGFLCDRSWWKRLKNCLSTSHYAYGVLYGSSSRRNSSDGYKARRQSTEQDAGSPSGGLDVAIPVSLRANA